MSFARVFIDETKPCMEVKGLVNEEDWKFLQTVFPEHGFRSYFIGHCISKLANHLRKNGITNCEGRLTTDRFTTIAGLLSDLKFTSAQAAHESNDGCRVGGTSDEDARCAGESSDNALTALREGHCEVIILRVEEGETESRSA